MLCTNLAEKTEWKIFQVSKLFWESQQEDQLWQKCDKTDTQIVLIDCQVQHVEVHRKVVPKNNISWVIQLEVNYSCK